MKRKTKRAAIAIVSLVVAIIAIGLYFYQTAPAPETTESFSIDYPLPTSPLGNVLTYNGSMHIDMVLLSNGSITQGQRVHAKANGGMTLKFSKQVKQVIIQFQGASVCYLAHRDACYGQVIEAGGPAGIIMNQNQSAKGLPPPVSDIGPISLPIPIGSGNGDWPMDWQSAGTYYPMMTLSYWNGSQSQAYTLESMPVYVAPASQGPSLSEIVEWVIFSGGVGFATYIGLYLQIRDRRKESHAHIRNPHSTDA